MKRKKSTLVGGAALLALGNVVAKIIGALYRVPLTNILGAEGMGMYQLVFPVFALFMVLSGAGIPTALSRIVAEKRAFHEDAKKYFVVALISLALLSSISAAIVYFLSDGIADLQGNENVAVGYKIIAPSIFLVGIMGAFRGWFQGETYMVPTAVSNVIEQVVKLAVGLSLAIYLKNRGTEIAVFGAIFGVTASEVLALAYLVITYFVRERKKDKESLKITKAECIETFRIALPIAVVAILLPLSNFFDSMIVVNVLKLKGVATAVATAEYGLLSGPINSLVNLPVVTITALAIAIVPSVSVSRVKRDAPAILIKSALSLKIAYAIGMPSAIFMMIFSSEIISVLYPSLAVAQAQIARNLLVISASNIVFLSAMQIYVSLLQALDRTKTAVLSIVIAIIVKVALSVVLVGRIGINGGAVASVCFGATALIALTASFIRLTSLRLEEKIERILISAFIAGGLSYIPHVFILNDIVALVVGFVINYIIYFFLVLAFGVLDENEFSSLPAGNALKKLYRKIGFRKCDDERF